MKFIYHVITIGIVVSILVAGCTRKVTSPTVYQDYESKLTTLNEAGEKFEQWGQQYGDDEACQRTVNWLLTQEGIDTCGLSSDNSTIWIYFDSGIGAFIVVAPENTAGGAVMKGPNNIAMPSALQSSQRHFQIPNEAIIYAPYSTEDPVFPSTELYLKLAFVYYNYNSGLSKVLDEQVSIDKLKADFSNPSIGTYVWTGHGGLMTIYTPSDPFEVGTLITGEVATAVKCTLYHEDLINHRLHLALVRRAGSRFAITPRFVQEYGNFGQMPLAECDRVMFFAYACHSFNDSLRKAFLDKGVDVYCGFDKVVHIIFATGVSGEFFDRLQDTCSVQQAYDALPSTTDPREPHAEFKIDGYTDHVLPARILFKKDGALLHGFVPSYPPFFAPGAAAITPSCVVANFNVADQYLQRVGGIDFAFFGFTPGVYCSSFPDLNWAYANYVPEPVQLDYFYTANGYFPGATVTIDVSVCGDTVGEIVAGTFSGTLGWWDPNITEPPATERQPEKVIDITEGRFKTYICVITGRSSRRYVKP